MWGACELREECVGVCGWSLGTEGRVCVGGAWKLREECGWSLGVRVWVGLGK